MQIRWTEDGVCGAGAVCLALGPTVCRMAEQQRCLGWFHDRLMFTSIPPGAEAEASDWHWRLVASICVYLTLLFLRCIPFSHLPLSPT